MRGPSRFAIATLICLAVPAAAVQAEEAKKPVTMTPDQLKWNPSAGQPEVKTAVVWGDMNTGPHGAFHKFPADFTVPLHTHSSDMRIVVVSGTMAMAGEDGVETKLPAGSYFYQPNTYKHTTKCLAGSECVIYVTASGKFDLKPVAAPKK